MDIDNYCYYFVQSSLNEICYGVEIQEELGCGFYFDGLETIVYGFSDDGGGYGCGWCMDVVEGRDMYGGSYIDGNGIGVGI
jgi:hypothetical protein